MYQVNSQKLTEIARRYDLDLVIVLWRNSAASAPRRRGRLTQAAILTWPCVGSSVTGKTWKESWPLSVN